MGGWRSRDNALPKDFPLRLSHGLLKMRCPTASPYSKDVPWIK